MRSDNEPMLYIKKKGNDFIIVCLYVDDIIYSSSSVSLVDEFKSQMMNEFEMSDMGLLHYFWALKSIKLKIEYFFHKGNMPRTFSLSLVCLIASMLLHL